MTAILVRVGDVFGWIWQRVLDEPVFTQGLVVAGIALATSFGLRWDGLQVGAVSAFSAAFLSWLTRRAVTSVSNPTLPQGTVVTVETPVGVPDTVKIL